MQQPCVGDSTEKFIQLASDALERIPLLESLSLALGCAEQGFK